MSRGTRTSVAMALAYRQLTVLLKNPSLFVPPMLFPLMSFAAFAGGLSRLSHVPGFDFKGGYTAFQFVFVLLQSAAFGGVFMGFSVARDFERDFALRLLLAAPHRSGIVWGYALAALLRWSMVAVALTIVALLAHIRLIMIANSACSGRGIAMRFRSVQAGPLMQIPMFMLLFLAPVYVPLPLLSGWIHAVATVNPVTAFLQTGRGFISGDRVHSMLAFAIALAMIGGLAAWALRGLRRAERAV